MRMVLEYFFFFFAFIRSVVNVIQKQQAVSQRQQQQLLECENSDFFFGTGTTEINCDFVRIVESKFSDIHY